MIINRRLTRRGFFLPLVALFIGMRRSAIAQMPHLSITITGNVVRVTATTPTPNMSLQVNDSLGTNSSWTTVTNGVTNASGTELSWTLPRENNEQGRHFRVRTATLKVGEKVYKVPAGQTLFQAMTSLASTDPSFTFYHEQRPLGRFVTTVNGVTSPKWVFTVNGQQQLTSGVSDYVVGGDIIRWLTI